MGLKEQWNTIKKNWLIALMILIILVLPLFRSGTDGGIIPLSLLSSYKSFDSGFGISQAATERALIAPSYGGDSFAPDVTERKITKSAYLSNEVKRGTFKDAESKLKAIAQSSDSYLLNENVYKSDVGIKSYLQGDYQIKVETAKYDTVLSQLKEIGDVQSFSENKEDVTGQYTDLKVELAAEKERLARYEAMYKEASKVEDKINLNNLIFDQERRVKYLEDAVKNIDTRVDYSTVSVNLREKQSEYINVALVKLSDLVRSFVDSVNTLLKLLFVIVPYVVIILLGWFVFRKVRK